MHKGPPTRGDGEGGLGMLPRVLSWGWVRPGGATWGRGDPTAPYGGAQPQQEAANSTVAEMGVRGAPPAASLGRGNPMVMG